MIIARKIVESKLSERFTEKLTDKKTAKSFMQNTVKEMDKRYNYPSDKTVSIINEKIPLDSLNSEEVFWLLSVVLSKEVEKSYTEKEIKKYSSMQYKREEFNSLSIHCLEVSQGEQWIGVLPNAAEFFVNLRNNRKIYYNSNAQRAMTMERLKNGKVLWRITINRGVLKKIRECFKTKKFIPNTITLNIDPDTETEVNYQDGILSITNLDHFDITDGFHRYRALCDENDIDPSFSYPMEIRITRFSDNKASYFVWQEDQKTPMKRKDAAALNTESIESKIVRRLNDSDGCLQDNIGRNNSRIQIADVVEAIKKVYDTKHIYNQPDFIKETAKQINRKWNAFVDEYPDVFTDKYSSEVVMKMIQHSKENTPIQEMYNDFVS